MEHFMPFERLGTMRVEAISPGQLRASQVQPRSVFDKEKISELAQSMRIHGVLQPLLIRKTKDDNFEIIAGERRWRAAKHAKLEKVPCIVVDWVDDRALAAALVENVQREDLNAIEEANAYKRLKETLGLNQEQIANKVGKDRATIANSLRLLNLPSPVQNLLIAGLVTMGHARALLSLEEPDMILFLAKKIVRDGLSVRRAESIVRSIKKGSFLQPVKKDANCDQGDHDPTLMQIRKALEGRFGTKVDIKKSDSGFVLNLHFTDERHLNGLLERLGIQL